MHEITSLCIDNRLHQMAFFSCSPKLAKAGQRPAFAYVEIFSKSFISSSLFCYYIKQIGFHVAVRLFSNRSQKTTKCGKNIIDTLGYASCATFFLLTTF